MKLNLNGLNFADKQMGTMNYNYNFALIFLDSWNKSLCCG